ncbi:hypothetical protein ACFPM7_28765 [Actinokineospora guangxiensis]|uniref:Uncharacterized protein n=1 Tax=Actinokineospora guangxiensis TaxID=1490288 RepID=A0ABW0EY03_9PSEU
MNAVAVTAGHDRMVVLLRRLGVVAGFVVGVGFLAVVTAQEASAEDRGLLGDLTAPVVEQVVEPVLKPVTAVAAPVVEPVAKAAAPVVEPVAEAVAPLAVSVVEPVRPVVKPVLEPVASAVEPLVASVSPLVEPLTAPVVRAAEPVLAPIADAGAEPVLSRVGLPSGPAAGGPAEPEQTPAPRPEADPVGEARPGAELRAPEAVSANWNGWSAAPSESALESTVEIESARPGGSGTPQPGPAGPVPGIATTTGTSAGSGGAHHADHAVAATPFDHAVLSAAGRSPPREGFPTHWSGYEDQDHPS